MEVQLEYLLAFIAVLWFAFGGAAALVIARAIGRVNKVPPDELAERMAPGGAWERATTQRVQFGRRTLGGSVVTPRCVDCGCRLAKHGGER